MRPADGKSAGRSGKLTIPTCREKPLPTEPETYVHPGEEDRAIKTHVQRMTHWVARRQIQTLLEEFNEEERARRKLLKIAFGLFALVFFGFVLFSVTLPG